MSIINTALILILMTIAVFILIKLIQSKNGRFRKIMIGYFLSELILLTGFLYLELAYGKTILHATQWVFFVSAFPKCIVKMALYTHITK